MYLIVTRFAFQLDSIRNMIGDVRSERTEVFFIIACSLSLERMPPFTIPAKIQRGYNNNGPRVMYRGYL
jgi:hypothetical protein